MGTVRTTEHCSKMFLDVMNLIVRSMDTRLEQMVSTMVLQQAAIAQSLTTTVKATVLTVQDQVKETAAKRDSCIKNYTSSTPPTRHLRLPQNTGCRHGTVAACSLTSCCPPSHRSKCSSSNWRAT